MESALAIATLVAMVALVAGLVRPSLVRQPSRGGVVKVFGSATVACLVLIALLVDLPEGESQPNTQVQTESPIPDFEIAEVRDVSFGVVRRLNPRIALPEHYSEQEIVRIAEAVVEEVTAQEDVNALSMMFYGPGTPTDGAWDVGSIDWAPRGVWGDAANVQAGDYRTFDFSVTYRPSPS